MRLLSALSVLAMVLSSVPTQAQSRFVFESAQMGVPFTITLYAPDATVARQAADAAFERVKALNSVFSDYDPDSELSRLSHSSGKPVPVSAELWQILVLSKEVSERSEGAFDITIGPLVNLWRRARRQKELPKAELLAEARSRVGFRFLRLDAAHRTAELLRPDMRLDLGGIAKGVAVDAALKVLSERGITRALVAASGDIGASDAPPDKPAWVIEVAPIDAPNAPPAQIVHLRNSAVSTSGDTFQKLELNGVRYSHIVDPRTGLGLTDHSLVTVVGPNCTTTDSLETTVSILGPEKGLQLIRATPGTAVHFVRASLPKPEVFDSENWAVISGGQ